MRSSLNRALAPLVAGAAQPRRTAAAFALGTFLSFSPFLGVQIGVGLALAYAFRLSRPAVVVGLCTNLPWVMLPWYAFTTIAGARLLGWPLPQDSGQRLRALAASPVYTGDFWQRAADLVGPLAWSFVVGTTAGAALLGLLAYVVAERFLTRVRFTPPVS